MDELLVLTIRCIMIVELTSGRHRAIGRHQIRSILGPELGAVVLIMRNRSVIPITERSARAAGLIR